MLCFFIVALRSFFHPWAQTNHQLPPLQCWHMDTLNDVIERLASSSLCDCKMKATKRMYGRGGVRGTEWEGEHKAQRERDSVRQTAWPKQGSLAAPR